MPVIDLLQENWGIFVFYCTWYLGWHVLVKIDSFSRR